MREIDGTEHRVIFRRGTVVDVRVAGLFDPILEALLEEGALSPGTFVTALEGLGRSQRRAGDIAVDAAGRLFVTDYAYDFIEQTFPQYIDWQASDVAFRLEILPLIRRSIRGASDHRRKPRVDAPAEMARMARERGSRGRDDRRALRRLAFALHPDRHADLSDAKRERLAIQLAEATAAFHGL